MSPKAQDAASEISKYLTTGMHHNTKEAQERIAEIISKHCKKRHRRVGWGATK